MRQKDESALTCGRHAALPKGSRSLNTDGKAIAGIEGDGGCVHDVCFELVLWMFGVGLFDLTSSMMKLFLDLGIRLKFYDFSRRCRAGLEEQTAYDRHHLTQPSTPPIQTGRSATLTLGAFETSFRRRFPSYDGASRKTGVFGTQDVVSSRIPFAKLPDFL